MSVKSRPAAILLALVGALLLLVGATATSAFAAGDNAQSRGRTQVELAVDPGSLSANGLPCLPTSFEVSLTNTGAEPVFADATITADEPIVLSRDVFSTYLPATDPDQPVAVDVGVTVPRDTEPGSYNVQVESGRQSIALPIEVTPIPDRQPGDDLAYGEQAIASSTHGNFELCGGVDGDRSQENWDISTGWNDGTSGVFPDWYGVEWPTARTVDRVEVWTKTPAETRGLRDFDVQVRDGDTWRTVAQVTGNAQEHVVSTFPAEQTAAVRLLIHATHDAYSRILELEVYGAGSSSLRQLR